MHFQDMEYRRPPLDATVRQIRDLTERMRQAESYAQARKVFLESEAFFRRLDTLSELVNIRHCINTRDTFYNAETSFWSAAAPVIGDYRHQFADAICGSAFRPEFEAEYGLLMFRNFELQKHTFDSRITEELRRENNLMREYESLIAGGSVLFEGRSHTLPGMMAFKTLPDDKRRWNAWQADGAWFRAHSAQIDRIFSELVDVRDTMGKKLGYENYLPLGYARRCRNCYTEADVDRYRALVRTYIVPIAERICREKAARNGVAYPLSYADDALSDRTGNPIPVGGQQGILDTTARFYRSLSEEAGSFFKMMLDNGLMDIPSRAGKAGGGYCACFPTYKVPFIFTNFNGTQEDVKLIAHESGHAFEVYLNRERVPFAQIWATGEACEINSTAMEFLAEPYAEEYFGKDAAKYRRSHLEETIIHIPYGAAIDHFQHICYRNPNYTAEQRHVVWREMTQMYTPWLRLDGGIPFYAEGMRWQAQRHLFVGPLYYLDYSLAETVSLEIWAKMRSSFADAFRAYMAYTVLGGSDTFLGLLSCAGFANPFEEETIQRLATALKDGLRTLE